MLTGQRPYVGQSLTEMSDAILGGAATPPSQLETGVSPELERIVARALARDLDRRYRTAGELRDDLRSLQSSMMPMQPTVITPALPAPVAHMYAPRPANAPAPRPRATLRPNSLQPVPLDERTTLPGETPRSHDPWAAR
jgi:hypothetical protein